MLAQGLNSIIRLSENKKHELYMLKKILSFHSFCKLKINKNFAFTKEKIQLYQLTFLMLLSNPHYWKIFI